MYHMLVKVFDIEQSHFVLKAGIVAWGKQRNLRIIISSVVKTKTTFLLL